MSRTGRPAGSTSHDEPVVVDGRIVRLSGRAWGLALGLLFALSILVATTILLLKGGEDVGPHLQLLSQYFPGYSVSYVGALIGAVYAFVVGNVVGRLICFVYNRAARR